LPIVADAKPGINAPAYEPFRIGLTPAGRLHEVVRLYDDLARNESQWEKFAEFFWCAAALRPKPGASVLLSNSKFSNEYGPLPIVAVQPAGDGTVLYVGDDTTFRWRENVGDRYFYKFWGQAIRHVARRPHLRDQIKLQVTPQQIIPGEEVQVVATGPLEGQTLTVAVNQTSMIDGGSNPENPVTQNLTLTRDPHSAAPRYVGKARVEQEGRYLATLTTGNAQAEFAVVAGVEEFQHPEVNREALEAASRASGGRLLELDELIQLPELLSAESTVRRLRQQQDLWDRWYILLLVAGLYLLDVGIRRWTGLM
jgi:hypothetical protein